MSTTVGYKSQWREKAASVIREVINEVGTEDEKALKKALREAYPFGPKAMHPYKIWLDEIKVQTGQKETKAPKRVTEADRLAEGQTSLFELARE